MASRVHAPLLLVVLVLTSPGVSWGRTDPLGGTGGGPIAGAVHVRVVQQGTGDPLPGAFVMVGPREGEPFPGNWGWTDANGAIDFGHPSLQGATTVTAGATGHAYFTILAVNASDLVLPLRAVEPELPAFQIGDYVSGIDVNNGPFHAGDGNLDLAFVVPSFRLEEVLNARMAPIMGPPDVIYILDQAYEIPSNVFIPQQWEIFTEIVKDHYALYLPGGATTLTALSGRVPLEGLMNAQDPAALLQIVDWREADILPWNVTGNSADADLAVDPDLVDTVTLNLANIPDDCVAYAFSLGDLDNLHGLGRVIPLGMNALNCPAGSGPCAGPLTLSTTAATGEFAGMGYFPMVTVSRNGGNDNLGILARGSHAQTYTETMSSFFSTLDLAYAQGVFSASDVENGATGSPPVHVQIASLSDTTTGGAFWTFMMPGGLTSFGAPGLPDAAPPVPPLGTPARWNHVSFALAHDLPAFDFDAFAFSDVWAHGSHFASDELEVAYLGDPAGIAPSTEAHGAVVLFPNPARDALRIRFTQEAPGGVSLRIIAIDGREIASPFVAPGAAAGTREIVWNRLDAQGKRVRSGVYVARLSGPGLERSAVFILTE